MPVERDHRTATDENMPAPNNAQFNNDSNLYTYTTHLRYSKLSKSFTVVLVGRARCCDPRPVLACGTAVTSMGMGINIRMFQLHATLH